MVLGAKAHSIHTSRDCSAEVVSFFGHGHRCHSRCASAQHRLETISSQRTTDLTIPAFMKWWHFRRAQDMRAFHVPQGKGIYIHPGTWSSRLKIE